MPKVGLICATKYELPEIIPYRNSKQIQTYNIGNFDIGVIISDVGPENAKTATKKLYLDYKPDWIIVFGICGGSQIKLVVGDIIIANKIHYNGDEIVLKCSQLEGVKTCLSNNLITYHVGKLQTFDHPVLSRKEVLADVLGVDMESYVIVDEANKHNIPSIIIKSFPFFSMDVFLYNAFGFPIPAASSNSFRKSLTNLVRSLMRSDSNS